MHEPVDPADHLTKPGGTADDNAIAVIGMACRLPGARNLEEYWANLVGGVDSVTRFPEQTTEGQDRYIPARGLLADPEWFDAEYFGLSPREARLISPQHRVFLECATEALDHAGCDPYRYEGSVGVYGGGSQTGYGEVLRAQRHQLSGVTEWEILLGSGQDFMVSRTAYKLGMTGPAVNVQSACATSLVAVHTAAQALLAGDCDVALAGAASVHYPEKHSPYTAGGIIAQDGICRAFDALANGTVGGDGAGVVVLKRLSDALVDGDAVHAVVLGTAVNNDGSVRAGFTAPSVDGQAEVVRAAHRVSRIASHTVGYVEAHGTGTPLGDPIEIEALTRAFLDSTDNSGFCSIGSVKTNIGHTDVAAGIAGFIKSVLSLKHGIIPPSLHFDTPNPHIDFESGPFRVVTSELEWKTDGTPRRAGVSSFGIGGTNAHVVLEEAARPEPADASRTVHLLPLSARTPAALDSLTRDLTEHLRGCPEESLADIAWSLQTGRREMPWRRYALVRSGEVHLTVLDRAGGDRLVSSPGAVGPTPVTFAFSGRTPGKQTVARLLSNEPAFRGAFDEVADATTSTLRSAVRTGSTETTDARVTALVTLANNVGEARVLAERGLEPASVTGYGVGALAAGVVAGTLRLADACALTEHLDDASRLEEKLGLTLLSPPTVDIVQGPDGRTMSAAEVRCACSWTALLGSEPPKHLLGESDSRIVGIGEPHDEDFPESTLGELWLGGAHIRWTPDGARNKVPLPLYPFERQRYIVEAETTAEPEPDQPRTDTQAHPDEDTLTTVTRVYGETLGMPGFAAEHDFFDHGGDSLISIDLLERLREIYRVELDSLAIFDAPTPAAMTRLIGDRIGEKEPS
ncbi:beta-ketoacyl synthase N-terminal-like domain-containing protein [Streptomonospora salina]|uniref:Acyl transferase domain-containing protein n=1 Tax=Streptomonospora salina TaxID=104205 RepID=A0A841EAK8_9ACTN|nr:beta-ketoacyl synthase N-terminal-like domain-containing protein [Streptomonospora salina]MBB6000036.1 acyl transferase domain-containing protein [Streptomonospora salina]